MTLVFADLLDIPKVSQRRAVFLTALPLLAAGAAILFHFDPNGNGSGVYPACPFRALTGYYCPGCGSARGLHALMHGDLAAAFGYNPLMVLSLPLVLYWMLSQAWLAWKGTPLPMPKMSGATVQGIFFAIILFGVLRNIPHFPFSLLAP